MKFLNILPCLMIGISAAGATAVVDSDLEARQGTQKIVGRLSDGRVLVSTSKGIEIQEGYKAWFRDPTFLRAQKKKFNKGLYGAFWKETESMTKKEEEAVPE